MKKNNDITFKQLANVMFVNTKIAAYNESEFLGWYYPENITMDNGWIIESFWAIDENQIGIRFVKE